MAIAIAHFAVGVSITCVLLTLTDLHRTRIGPYLTFVGGLFAMVPDIGWVIPVLNFPLSTHPIANIFFFHHGIDTIIDPTDSLKIAALFILVMCISLSVMYKLSLLNQTKKSAF